VRLGFAISTVATAAFIGVYFHVEVAAFLTGYNFRELASRELRKPDSVVLRPRAEIEQAKAQVATLDAAQITQAVETSALEAGQSLKNEQRSEASANEPAALMQEAKAAQAMAADAKPQRRALEEAQARAAALSSELAGKSREIETQAAQLQKAADAATKEKQAMESTVAELRQSLEQEQKKTAALMQEAKAAQAMTANTEPQRRALEEAQTRAAALASELDGATKQKQAAEANALELQKSLQQERDRTEAMARDLATVRRTTDGRVTDSADSYVTQVTQKVKTAATEPPKAAEARGGAEAAKLIERASGLLGQGNIGAARIVLERAAESGNARASFMLAETYDPVILSAWGTFGTRGEAAKAREHYAKAHAGGIQEAKGRLDAMRQ
jgi:chromosome segregation ATPase